MRTDVCAVEWDGHGRLGVTIDIYCYIFCFESYQRPELVLERAYQRWQGGWCGPSSANFEPRPDLVRLAHRRAVEHWELYAMAYGQSPHDRPAFLLFYDRSQEVFDMRRQIAALVASVAAALDMGNTLRRSST